MTVHEIPLDSSSLIGCFSKEIPSFITVRSGDRIKCTIPDAGWGMYENGIRVKPYDRPPGAGHALIGPVYVEGAKAGMTLAVTINELVTGPFGFTAAGHYPNWQNRMLGLTAYDEIILSWKLSSTQQTGSCAIGGKTFQVALNPFLGVMGMPPNEPGNHSTFPPRSCGGNIDCKELVKGSTLYLPISVDGALFCFGDGHAAQGDGEVSCQAIECPMELADITITLEENMAITQPRAFTPNGWVTFGFHEDLNEATVIALDGMLQLMGEKYGLDRVEAIAIGSSVIDLRITQIVNGVKGVHAVLPHNALSVLEGDDS